MPYPSSNRWIAALAGATLALSGAHTAVAHPHVWISVETTVLVEQGSVIGFRHRWTFDEFYTSMAIQGLDTNNDGVYSREELTELAQVNIDGLKEFGYFTFVKLGEKDLAVDAPKDYWLEHGVAPASAAQTKAQQVAPAPQPADTAQPGMLSRLRDAVIGPSKSDAASTPAAPAKVLSLEFTLPLKQPVLTEAAGFSFSIYDPSWFIAFDVANTDAIRLGPGAPAGCRLEFGDRVTASADDAKRIQDAFTNQFGGSGGVTLSGTTIAKLNCSPRS